MCLQAGRNKLYFWFKRDGGKKRVVAVQQLYVPLLALHVPYCRDQPLAERYARCWGASPRVQHGLIVGMV